MWDMTIATWQEDSVSPGGVGNSAEVSPRSGE